MGAFLNWIDARFPLISTWKHHVSEYYAPKNFNFSIFWFVGVTGFGQSDRYWLVVDHVLYPQFRSGL